MLPGTTSPVSILLAVGVDVCLGGRVQLVKLLGATSYVKLIADSMSMVSSGPSGQTPLVISRLVQGNERDSLLILQGMRGIPF